jgi:hypothetical protein
MLHFLCVLVIEPNILDAGFVESYVCLSTFEQVTCKTLIFFAGRHIKRGWEGGGLWIDVFSCCRDVLRGGPKAILLA